MGMVELVTAYRRHIGVCAIAIPNTDLVSTPRELQRANVYREQYYTVTGVRP